MARILLGVTGGIAAYKAVELVRLATKAGHSVRVVQTPARSQFVGARHLRGHHRRARAGRRVRARPGPRRLSRASPRPTTSRSATSSWSRARDVYAIAPAIGEHDREARRRAGRQPADQRRARLPAPAARRAGDEQPHVRARRRRRRTSRRCASAACTIVEPGTGALASKGRVGRRPAGRAGRDPRRDRAGRPATGCARARSTACGCWSPPAGRASRSTRVRYVGNRSSGGWASRWRTRRRAAAPSVTVVAANVVAAAHAAASRTSTWRRPPSSSARCERVRRRATCC